MQIFTIEMLIQMYTQSREIAQELFGVLIAAAWDSVAASLGGIVPALTSQSWNELLVQILLLIGGLVMLFRLIRYNLRSTLKFLLDR